MVPLKQGRRVVRGVRNKRERCMALPHGILTRNMVVPPTIVSSEVYVPGRGKGGRMGVGRMCALR